MLFDIDHIIRISWFSKKQNKQICAIFQMMQIIHSPFVMVIFGAAGDLTRRKLIPALYSLLKQKVLPERFFVVGVARRPFSHEDFRALIRETARIPDTELKSGEWSNLEKNLYYQQGLFEDEKSYQSLVKLLKPTHTYFSVKK